MKSLISTFLFCFLSFVIIGQTKNTIGLIPRINFSIKGIGKQSIKSSIESRQGFFDSSREDKTEYENILTDYSIFLSNKLQSNMSLNVGYMLRTRGDDIFHRISQHLNIAQPWLNGRLGHRIGTDQTFTKQKNTVYRMRYRAVFEKSLAGERIDKNEFYTKLGSEILYQFTQDFKDEDNFEWRLLPSFGYEINRSNKIEWGLDVRFKKLFSEELNLAHWFRLSWYYGFVVNSER